MSEHGVLIDWYWNGTAMVPTNRFAHLAQREFTEGVYRMEAFTPDARSDRSHRHQFAFVAEAWRNLPETMQEEPWAATPETMRKHALIMTGWCDVATELCGSKAAAQRMAALLGSMASRAHGYAIVSTRGEAVVCKTPRSQSYKAMGGKDFQKSKDDILNWCADLLGVTPEELQRARAA